MNCILLQMSIRREGKIEMDIKSQKIQSVYRKHEVWICVTFYRTHRRQVVKGAHIQPDLRIDVHKENGNDNPLNNTVKIYTSVL